MNSSGHSKGINRWLKNEHLWAIAVLVIVLAVFFRDVVFDGRTFLMETATTGTMSRGGPYNYHGTKPGFVANDAGAIAWFSEPFNRFLSISLKKGDFPLWDPYAGLAGAPLMADGVTGPLEPIQFIFFFFPDRFWPYTVDLQLLIRFLLAGFGCYLFAKRLKLKFWASISAGILFMLSSYFVTFGNHPEIKTESLLPLVLYGYDRLADLEDRRGFWFCSLFIGWSIIAAMPESTFFGLFLGSLWYFYKSTLHLVNQESVLPIVKNSFSRYFVSTIFGFLISAAYLFPFIEYVLISKSVHAADSYNQTIPLIPLRLLPLFVFQVQNINYYRFFQLGFFALFSLTYAVMGLTRPSKYRTSVIFFSSYAILFLLLFFNFPLTNWIRNLPVFNQINLLKYAIPSIVFCLAIVAGIFINEMTEIPPSYKRIVLSQVIVVFIFVILPVLGNPPGSVFAYFPETRQILSAVGLIFGISISVYLLAFLYEHQKIGLHVLQVGFLLLIAAEPFFWGSTINRPDRVDPYQTPPFMDFLRDARQPFRIFGLDGILYPNISSAYQVTDIRWIDALFPTRAVDFSKRYLTPHEPDILQFTGTQFPISDKMFDILNVKYVLSMNKLDRTYENCPSSFQNEPSFLRDNLANVILQQNSNNKNLGVNLHVQPLTICNSTKMSVFEQPPQEFTLKVSVPQTPSELDFSIGLNPEVFKPEDGDGVNFQISINNQANVFSQYIDPKNNPDDRKWFAESIKLDQWSGQEIVLKFSTNGGPAGNNSMDWAYWGDVRLVNQPAQRVNAGSSYELVYKSHDVIIYQNQDVLPRAFVVYKVVNVSGPDAALSSLDDPALDLSQTAVVENLPDQKVVTINRNDQKLQSVAGSVKQVNSGESDVQVDTAGPGLLVVSDQYYPGWEAIVDGKQAPIYAVDGIFRGIFLEPGGHMIKFIYRPLSFIFGGIISLLSMLITLGFIIFGSRLSQNHHE